jgi:hypothetical protein
MKRGLLFMLFGGLLLGSCTFGTRTGHITMRKSAPVHQIYAVSDDSIKMIFDQDAFFNYMHQQPGFDSIRSLLVPGYFGSAIDADSIDERLVLFKGSAAYAGDFWMNQLDKGNVYILDLSTGRQIRRVKTRIRYYRGSRPKKKMFASYTKDGKEIYVKRLMIIDF